MVAEIMMGVYFNLSFWYKLIDKTIWGAWFSMAGCIVLIAVNVIFIPEYGYMACAWGGVAGYGTAMVLSYIVGQKKYPIEYDLKGIGRYVALTFVLFCIMNYIDWPNAVLQVFVSTLLILFYLYVVVKKDMPHDTISHIRSILHLR
jgi:O-antigen/teichoic acid export membrane protein